MRMTRLTITTDPQICKFTIHAVPDRPGVAADMFCRFGAAGINVLMMVCAGAGLGRTDISLTVSTDDAPRLARALATATGDFDARSVSERNDIAAISVISEEMRRVPGVAGRMFRTLSAQGINIDMISAASDAVTCVIDERFLSPARTALEKEFHAELAAA